MRWLEEQAGQRTALGPKRASAPVSGLRALGCLLPSQLQPSQLLRSLKRLACEDGAGNETDAGCVGVRADKELGRGADCRQRGRRQHATFREAPRSWPGGLYQQRHDSLASMPAVTKQHMHSYHRTPGSLRVHTKYTHGLARCPRRCCLPRPVAVPAGRSNRPHQPTG